MRYIFLIFALALFHTNINYASESADKANILDSLKSGNSPIIIEQPKALSSRMQHSSSASNEDESHDIGNHGNNNKSVGYRVQIYSDNNQRTARAEAQRRANAVHAHFPQYKVHVVFQSPYWRVKIGDFRSRSQAEETIEDLRQKLPAYGKEMRVIRDHINFSE